MKEQGLSDIQKFQLMNDTLLIFLFPFIEVKNEEEFITGWYFSRKWEYSDAKGLWNFSVRPYLNVKKEFLETVEKDLLQLANDHNSVLSIQNEPVDEKLVTLLFIQRACEAAKDIILEYPNWDRRFNRHCYNKVGYEVQELKNSMCDFEAVQKNQAAHFILFNTHLLEYPDGFLADWNLNSNRDRQFMYRIPSALERFQ